MRRKPNRSQPRAKERFRTRKHRCVRRFQTSRRMRTVTCSVPRRNLRRWRCGTFLRAELPLPAGAFSGRRPSGGEGAPAGLVSCLAAYARGLTCSARSQGTNTGAHSDPMCAQINLNERTSPRPRYLCWRIVQISWVVVNSASPRKRSVEIAR